MPPVEPEPTPRRPEPTYGLTRQQREEEQRAIWNEAAADAERLRRKLRNELVAIALVLLAAGGAFVFFMSR